MTTIDGRATDWKRRAVFVVLALATIVAGLVVHRGGIPLGPVARDVTGDALWAAMIAWGLGAVAPRRPIVVRSAVALAVCVAVELSQLVHTPSLDVLRTTTLGHLVLGQGFDPRDLAAYTLGVAVASLLEWKALRRFHEAPAAG
jgi:hypothetical protein